MEILLIIVLDIIKGSDPRINYWVSEKDNGIYDAQNKGDFKSHR